LEGFLVILLSSSSKYPYIDKKVLFYIRPVKFPLRLCMDISIDRSQGPLKFQLSGRMEGFGAQQVTDAIRSALRERDREIIFDLGGLLLYQFSRSSGSSGNIPEDERTERHCFPLSGRGISVESPQNGWFSSGVHHLSDFRGCSGTQYDKALRTDGTDRGGISGADADSRPARLIVRGDISRIAAGNITTADLFRIPLKLAA
jgi:hypothetical protein